MSRVRRVLICLPEQLLSEADGLASAVQLSRSALIREAVRHYIIERKRLILKDQMKKGYIEMAELNLDIAGEHFSLEAEANRSFEPAAGVKHAN